MSDALIRFPTTRTAALERLNAFLPKASKTYTARRNYDLGRDGHNGVSQLSPYIRARLLTEAEVLEAVLARFAPSSAEKFIQEVYWRTYWKGWLEMRPSVWSHYQKALNRALNNVQTQSGLRARWEAACAGDTEIEAFNAWARELTETGYMHNHARMWFASIWIWTLELPWELGADYFLRHLLDGDPASNTLSWRWVAGIQTAGKTYQARASNIAKYTEGRFKPMYQLSNDIYPIDAPPAPERMPVPEADPIPEGGTIGLILHDDDLSPGFLLDQGVSPAKTIVLTTRHALSPLQVAPHVVQFADQATQDCVARYGPRLGSVSTASNRDDIAAWAEDLDHVVTPYAPVGPAADMLKSLQTDGIHVKRIRRSYDSAAWPHATAGFFKFKAKIPTLLSSMRGTAQAS